jgi:hypothetical protein
MLRRAAIKTRKTSADVFPIPRLSNPVFGNIAALKKVADRIADDPKEARKFLLRAGIITKDGKLSPNYGGGK